ncbi:MAG TPA: HAMP domain-containing sensor histidine kinase [Trebonia sp.]
MKGLRALSDRTPLRTKLIGAFLALVIVTLTAISVTTVVVLRSYLTTRYDDVVTQAFEHISAEPYNIFGGNPPGYAIPLVGLPNGFGGIQLDGTPLKPDPNYPGISGFGSQRAPAVPNVPTTQSWATANAQQLVTVGSVSGPDVWRVMTTPVTFNNQSGIIVVAYDLGPINAEIRRLVTVELIMGAAIVVVLTAVTVGVVRANLRPLDDIEMTAGQIAKGHLNHRIPERDPRTEIGSLGHSLNAMLAQIETAFHAREKSEQAAHDSEERMRRFIADASHELRTPLTTIRGFAEYYRQRGGLSSGTDNGDSPATADSPAGLGRADIDRIMQRLESEAARMGLLVEDLLQLARLDQQRPLDLAPADLLTLSADAVQDARIVAPDRPVDLVIGRGAAFIVEGDEQRLRQVIGNLVGNAITHTPDGTPVRVKLSAGSMVPPVPASSSGDGAAGNDAAQEEVPAVVLDVEDDGPGMTAEQSRRVFERFYRADAARNRASGGTGLGLAIVAGLVAAHGGTVSVKSAPGEGADFQVKLPLSPDAHFGEDDASDDDVDVSEDDVDEAAGQ